MNKQDVQRSLQKHGDFLNVSQIAKILGQKRETVAKQYLDGLDYLPNGREKLYFSGDVAEAICRRRING